MKTLIDKMFWEFFSFAVASVVADASVTFSKPQFDPVSHQTLVPTQILPLHHLLRTESVRSPGNDTTFYLGLFLHFYVKNPI